MNEMTIFQKEEFGSVRVVMQDEAPWFIAKDVCDALELSNVSQTLSYLDDDEKGITTNDTPGGKQEMSIISEAGLYSLILRSRKPEAKAFKRWVTHEVLPAIRKTGSYQLTPKDYIQALRALADAEEEKQLALEQRDYYKRTKAEIGSRREATAMATASSAVRKVNRLEDELGKGKNYKTVKAIPWLKEEFVESKGMYSSVGKTLRSMSASMGYAVKKVECPDYPNGLNAYHVDVIATLHKQLLQNNDLLSKYRLVF